MPELLDVASSKLNKAEKAAKFSTAFSFFRFHKVLFVVIWVSDVQPLLTFGCRKHAY